MAESAPTAPASADEPTATAAATAVSLFETEVEPFQLSLLDSGHFALFRRVWQDGHRLIQGESERLSRLIDNVLQLARMTRNDVRLRPQPVSAGELMEVIRSKVTSQVERVGFTLGIDCGADAAAAVVSVDADAFSQILINLVDNAIKFSDGAERKAVDIGCRIADRSTLVFWVRDYGPGVPPDQARKIFRLFYRVDGGLTRQTAGTGIGLALVRQLAEAMGGTVDIVNREPGAEFSACFPRLR